ncbi:hypothetical protein GSI_14159 [Ganoderma sinense ZZ0214-1]|uniref:Uncharacterized protein n=1 Tax=Ganoderma sinense ZZ0214-1 TaxID=1077348 RepID=A0A2G8RSB3_9APHY|nr:hypothetical protein GSI_14159 [Ganoderma sinense ZZ0214-1]
MSSPQSMPSSSLHESHAILKNYSTEHANHPSRYSAPQPPFETSVPDLLRTAHFRGDLADIPKRISDVINGRHPRIKEETLRALFHCLAELGVDFEAIHQTAAGTRYNRIHRDIDGDSASCSIRHNFPSNTASQYSSCCGLIATVHPDSEDTYERACYVGPHSQNNNSPPRTAPTAYQRSSPGFQFQPQPTMPRSSVTPVMVLATTSDSDTGFPSRIARTDRNCPSLQASPAMVNPTTPSTSSFASESASPAATLSELVPAPVPGAVGHTPTMADAHPQAAQWRTEAPPPPYPLPLPSPHVHALESGCTCTVHPDSSWSSGLHENATATRVPPPEVLIATIPWRESSLYHPPGWVQVPAALRDTPRSHGYGSSSGRSRGRGRDQGDSRVASESTSLRGMGKGAPTVAW